MLLDTLLALLQGWAPAFPRQRTCQGAIALALGLLCGLGRRTLTRALCFLGRQHRDWSADYRLFSRSRWESKALFLRRSFKPPSPPTAAVISPSAWTAPTSNAAAKRSKPPSGSATP